MSNIVEARSRLEQLRKSLTGNVQAQSEIGEILSLMHRARRRPGRRPSKSEPMSEELAARIRAYCHRHPTKSNAEVAHHFNVNPGRVSEAFEGQ